MSIKINVGICGIQGYSGSELLQLVMQHPYLQLAAVITHKPKAELLQEMPFIAKQEIPIFSMAEISNQKLMLIEVLFLATPVEVSLEIVSLLKDKNIKIIDLSGAFRLAASEFKQWYGIEHPLPDLLNTAEYGLLPWNIIKNNKQTILANPGCYATCALMALIPLLKNNLINADNIIIDAKSGVSGAGKKLNSVLMFCEIAENFFPYKIGKHQHIPEINNYLAEFAGKYCKVTFVTHMLPIIRGISMSIYLEAADDEATENTIAAAIKLAYEAAYQDYPLVNFGEINCGQIENDKFLLSLKSVVKTAKTHIAYFVEGKKIFIFVCIDNLLKGAASQAIENINALYDLPYATGLLT